MRSGLTARGSASPDAATEGLAGAALAEGLRRVTEAGLGVVLFGSAFFFGAVDQPWQAAVEIVLFVLAAVWVAAICWRSGLPLVWSPLFAPGAMLLGLVALQLLPLPAGLPEVLAPGGARMREWLGLPHGPGAISVYPAMTVSSFLRVLATASVFFLATQTVAHPRGLRRLLGVLVVLGTFEASYGLLNYLAGNGGLLWLSHRYYGSSATGTLVNRNHFAGLMGMCLPATLAYYWLTASGRDEERWRRLWFALLAIIMGVALIFSRSRMGITSFLLMSGTLMVGIRHRGGDASRLPLGILVAVGVYALLIGLDPVIERFLGGGGGRLDVWRDSLAIAADYPFFGSGFGTFAYISPVYKSSLTQVLYVHAHNDYLELLAEGGVAGVLIVGWGFWRFSVAVRQGLVGARGRRRRVLLAVLAGVGMLVLHGLADFNLHVPSNAFIFAALLATASLLAVDDDWPWQAAAPAVRRLERRRIR